MCRIILRHACTDPPVPAQQQALCARAPLHAGGRRLQRVPAAALRRLRAGPAGRQRRGADRHRDGGGEYRVLFHLPLGAERALPGPEPHVAAGAGGDRGAHVRGVPLRQGARPRPHALDGGARLRHVPVQHARIHHRRRRGARRLRRRDQPAHVAEARRRSTSGSRPTTGSRSPSCCRRSPSCAGASATCARACGAPTTSSPRRYR